MRITGGFLRGRILQAPRGSKTRPTSDRIKEAIMQHLEIMRLEGGFEGRNILDLFAGSGSLSFDAISRGATFATMIEQSSNAITVQKVNAEKLGCSSQVRIIKGKLPRALRAIKGESYDIIFADPPYVDVSKFSWDLLQPFLAAKGLLIIEHACKTPPVFTLFQILAVRNYSDTCITIATLSEG